MRPEQITRRFLLLVAAMVAVIAACPAQAQTESILHNFTGGSDGGDPTANLIADSAGNLYGTTTSGGLGYGTVFELTPDGHGGRTETVLYSFTGGLDGSAPWMAPVMFDRAGNLYGTTEGGGSDGSGTVFELSPSGTKWTETVLYSFSCQFSCNGGVLPVNGLIMDQAGNLYGTTYFGDVGVVFELSLSGNVWTEQPIFGEGSGGPNVTTGVVMDATGNIYVGAGNSIYELSPNGNGGWNSALLYNFANLDHLYAWGTVGTPVLDKAGNLYGATVYGGTKNYGAVYKLTRRKKGWTVKVLYSFKYGSDGAYPNAGITLDAAGNVYGTTTEGGTYNGGTVFELVPPVGTDRYQEKILRNFDYWDGYVPNDSLILDSAGNLYGTATYGGSVGFGVVFKLTP